ncbi:uncharacterized protein TEOVI_000369400 [Trypanosoma equiperdum]|uniref:Variant surface glycoprotein n=1 Tax=Trypanosoma equiperdum TaxID=5694 RepID=A0A1G4IIJ1_TRYEQ|nr:hypothetical protein, conserved [Trypanosoma equiperdum]
MTPLLAAVLLLQAVNADTTTLGHDATNWCHEYHYLKAVIEAARSELTSRVQTIKQDREQAMVWSLAAADEQAQGSGKAMQILSMATANFENLQLQALTAFADEIKLPLLYLQTRLDIFQSVQAAPSLLQFTMAAGTHAGGDATNTACTVPITFTASPTSICPPATSDLGIAAVKTKLATITKAKATAATSVNDLVQAAGINMQAQAGTWASSGSEQAGCQCTGSNCGTSFKITKAPTATAKTAGAPATKNLPDNADDLPASATDATTAAKHNEKHLLAVYKKLQAAFATKAPELKRLTWPQLKSLAREAGIDAALLDPLGTFGKPGTDASNSKLDAEMDRIYNSGTDFKTNFIDNAKTIKIKITDEAGSEPMALQEIVNKNEVSKALAYLKKQQLKKQLAEKSAATTAAATSASQTCTNKNKKADCKDGDGCKWTNEMEETGSHCKDKDDKKEVDKITAAECVATEEGKCDKNKCTWDKEKNQCKVKEGAAVISAVIKVPLLLAVLLF